MLSLWCVSNSRFRFLLDEFLVAFRHCRYYVLWGSLAVGTFHSWVIDSVRIGSYVLSFDCFLVVVMVLVEKEEVEEIGVMGCVFLVGCFESLLFFVCAPKSVMGLFWLL